MQHGPHQSSLEESTEHFFTSFTDLLVGIIFIFMLLLMVFALNYKQAETENKEAVQTIVTTEEVRGEILQAISDGMQERGIKVELDLNNGIVRLPEGLLFASGQWQLSEQGKNVLSQLAKVMGKVLPCSVASYRDVELECIGLRQSALLDSVLIEGHTDKQAFVGEGGMTNWELSAFRAISVYRALVEAEPGLETKLKNRQRQPILGVSAYAERRPVDSKNLDPNRRIDLRFNMRAPKVQ